MVVLGCGDQRLSRLWAFHVPAENSTFDFLFFLRRTRFLREGRIFACIPLPRSIAVSDHQRSRGEEKRSATRGNKVWSNVWSIHRRAHLQNIWECFATKSRRSHAVCAEVGPIVFLPSWVGAHRGIVSLAWNNLSGGSHTRSNALSIACTSTRKSTVQCTVREVVDRTVYGMQHCVRTATS